MKLTNEKQREFDEKAVRDAAIEHTHNFRKSNESFCAGAEWQFTQSQAIIEQQAARVKELEAEKKSSDEALAGVLARLTTTMGHWNDAKDKLSSASKMLDVMGEALRKVSSYFDCLDCEMQSGMVCEYHLEERMKIAKEALAQYEAWKKAQG